MNIYKIENIKNSNDNEVSVCPRRGGIITSLKLKGKEVFYFDEATLNDDTQIFTKSPVRGGVPILFPNAGEIKENDIFPSLKRHGFARDLNWDFEKTKNGFKEVLVSNEKIKEIYPYDFKLSVTGGFEDNGSFTIEQSVENTGERSLPVAMGLHPYFKVSNEEKKNIKFNFEGGKEVEEKFDIWSEGGTVYIDNPKINNPDNSMEVKIPSIGNIVLDVSKEYKKIWIWSQPGKDFVCIEPMERGLNGIIDDPEILNPKDIFKAYFNIYLD